MRVDKFTELEEYLSKELYDSGRANQSAGKLLDSLLIALSESGFNTPKAELSLKDYAKQIIQAAAVANATSEVDIVTQFNILLDHLRMAGLLGS